MPRLSADTWETVRAEREAGASFPELAARFGVSHTAVMKQAKAGGWGDGKDVAEAIRRKVSEKVSGIVSPGNPKKLAEAIDAEAERAVAIIHRHREETNAVRERMYYGLRQHKAAVTKEDKVLAFEDLKAAKISSETVLNIHRAERQAWGLDDAKTQAEITIVRSYGI